MEEKMEYEEENLSASLTFHREILGFCRKVYQIKAA